MVQEWRQRERELEVNIGAHFTLDTRDRIFGVRIPNNPIAPSILRQRRPISVGLPVQDAKDDSPAMHGACAEEREESGLWV